MSIHTDKAAKAAGKAAGNAEAILESLKKGMDSHYPSYEAMAVQAEAAKAFVMLAEYHRGMLEWSLE